jgi:outer membrane lipoprotein SlyB
LTLDAAARIAILGRDSDGFVRRADLFAMSNGPRGARHEGVSTMATLRPVLATTLVALALASCAQSYEPIVDMKGVDQARYQQDLAECRTYAEKVSPAGEAATRGVIGAGIGAALGAIVGAFGGGAGTGAALGAGVGGAGGAASGGLHGVEGQKQVINNCLRHRGYAVLR